MRQATDQEIKKFCDYRANHVALVQRIGRVVFDLDLSDHDHDKIEYSGEDLNRAALRNAMINDDYHPDSKTRKDLNHMVKEHILSQPHHPEYWATEYQQIKYGTWDDQNPTPVHCPSMPDRRIIEMCCDWAAVALKRNTPMFSWYNKVCTGDNPRFIFTNKQKKLIIESLQKILDKVDSEKLCWPGKSYTAKQVEPVKDFEESLQNSPEKLVEQLYEKEKEMLHGADTELTDKPCAFTFARMNPITIGHVETVIRKLSEQPGEKRVYLSHTQDKKNKKDPLKNKNPLSYEDKVRFATEAVNDNYPEVKIIKSEFRTFMEVLNGLYKEGFRNLTFIVGSDQLDKFKVLIAKYNGMFDEEGNGYDFPDMKYVLAGERIEDGEGISGMSATKLREAAVNGNFDEFKKGCPYKNDWVTEECYELIREAML